MRICLFRLRPCWHWKGNSNNGDKNNISKDKRDNIILMEISSQQRTIINPLEPSRYIFVPINKNPIF